MHCSCKTSYSQKKRLSDGALIFLVKRALAIKRRFAVHSTGGKSGNRLVVEMAMHGILNLSRLCEKLEAIVNR